ncbi:hypothetical protein CMQ_4363 [Grosmannia clavigera kw1407]|uniref:Uncharacterized protein n=1 Tax=Grosmannia clavigera (strain kw1407 / UAMH 11150) TaxID=655863 RepID=F0XU72_GROCL|nr:uncharacterized protein CMQ_4363 [Grosmannia clavigera kw1407]EFW98511.1 hypothetical protein CMQ_4363 [Grosmannia clavigera kw1407]
MEQIELAITKLSTIGAVKQFEKGTLWSQCRPYLIAIPCIIGLATVFMGFIAWKLYQAFAWDILKQIGADLRMKKRFLHYQIYIALLKFDFFFFLGFTVQFLVIVTGKTDIEFGLTAAAIPLTIVILLLGAYFTRNEIKVGMIISIGLYVCSLAWFFFKLVRIYEPGYRNHYEAVQKSLTAFAVLAIILIILTITNAFICMHNFGSGLKSHILRSDAPDEKVQYVNDTIGLNDIKPTALPTRMTID